MIKKILLWGWNFIQKLIPYVFMVTIIYYFYTSQKLTEIHTIELKNQVSELELQQATIYSEEAEILQSMIFLINNEDKKINTIVQKEIIENNKILKIIYDVDQNSYKREKTVSNSIDSFGNNVKVALQKPSYDYLKSITVRIIAREKTNLQSGWVGTGVIVAETSNYTIILTNRHVMPNDSEHIWQVIDGSNKYRLFNIKVSQNPDVDLSLCYVKGHIDGKRAVIGFSETKTQDPVYMVGQNLGRIDFYAEGFVAGFDEKSNDELVVGMPTGPGNSGSGIIDRKGRLVGLLYAGSIINEEFSLLGEMDIAHGLCMPIKTIRLFLAEYMQ